ncbi:MAG TPA: class I SAM-dependent methyltransferase [Chitinophagaceae bacterium]|nr:class I SAM-dependent methyltransferase [Chitinophagaceae bacterium]
MKEVLSNDEIIREHYRTQAQKHKDSALSTMEDPITRQKELDLIRNFFRLPAIRAAAGKVLEVGCGNGYTLSRLLTEFPEYLFTGIDFSEDLLEIARSRNLSGVRLEQGDARNLHFDSASFDVLFTERCIINLLSWEEQQQALNEMHRVLKPGGHLLFIESFTEGYENLNKARNELGLESIPMPHHNNYFERPVFEAFVLQQFEIVDPQQLGGQPLDVPRNFLSSHYFVARVLHPLLTKGDPNMKNTELVKFFSFLPPSGCYAAIEAYVLRKK